MTNNNIPSARLRLIELTDHSADCDIDDRFRPDDAHDIANAMLRDLLILDDDDTLDYSILNIDFDLDYYRDNYDLDLDIDALARELIDLLALIRTDPYSIHFLSQLRLDQSLCPLHHCDYAACFDDDDPECATIRAIFPSHDT